ncbi:MAG: hypothetical protein FRX48_07927 [Lasallia pustulata]|uniref:Uncharacterized protein n=1 Tax=Lasallia pustulata TaxID=136370 RepID=A0A5M8PG03_9LECA|nr:MAG: hypothetical protein FRX48_07927 [Lasallia pustulata]
MPPYGAFDGISEPRILPPDTVFLRLPRARRYRHLLIASLLSFLLLAVVWRRSNKAIHQKSLSGYRTPSSFSSPYASELASSEKPLLAPPYTTATGTKVPDHHGWTNTSFHLLVPASESNPNLCKTLLSSFLLDYPPPTLINYGKTFEGNGWDKGTHTGKIRGVYDYLRDAKQFKDDDLVLVIDGYDIWFQLPPEVMIKRYRSIVRTANERLRRQYGMISRKKPWEGDQVERVQMYTQKVVYGADKLCWPNPAEDPACAALPLSTLPTDVYGPQTDKDREGFLNRPRYLNSGTVIGPVADIRAIYERALQKVDEEDRGTIGDQFVFAEILGEQEVQRQVTRSTSQGAGGRWLDWLSNALGTSPPFNGTMNNMTVVPGQRYEFGLGLDYESQLFQTMTHSASDVEFLFYNDTGHLNNLHETHHYASTRLLRLPSDIRHASPPAGRTHGPDDPDAAALTGPTPNVPALPGNTTWLTLPLATNVVVPSIPTLLHFNGDKSMLDSWWPKLWFQPFSRSLLRAYLASPTASAWDTRGGRGGVWTDGKT